MRAGALLVENRFVFVSENLMIDPPVHNKGGRAITPPNITGGIASLHRTHESRPTRHPLLDPTARCLREDRALYYSRRRNSIHGRRTKKGVTTVRGEWPPGTALL